MTTKQKEAFKTLESKKKNFYDARATYMKADEELRQVHLSLHRAIKDEKLKLVYRLRNLEKQTLDKVAKTLGVTRERVRQLEGKITMFFIDNLKV